MTVEPATAAALEAEADAAGLNVSEVIRDSLARVPLVKRPAQTAATGPEGDRMSAMRRYPLRAAH